jgi:hypothetical protein
MKKKNRNKTVTSFPLLFPAESPKQAEGVASFAKKQIPIRQFTRMDRKQMIENLKGEKGEYLFALMRLHNTLASGDPFELERAKKRLEKIESEHAGKIAGEVREEVFAARPTEEQRGVLERMAPFTKEWIQKLIHPDFADLRRKLCFEVTDVIHANDTQLVIWWHKGRFVPAIYCPNLVVAYYIHTFFMAPMGEIGWRVCPWCSSPFEQNRANQGYCSNAHGIAYRMAKMRRRKAEAKGKRRPKSPRKSR